MMQTAQIIYQGIADVDGTDSRHRQNKLRKTQIKQTTHKVIVDANRVDKVLDNGEEAQTVDVNRASHRRRR